MTQENNGTFQTVLVPVRLIRVDDVEGSDLPTVEVGDDTLTINDATRRALELAGRLARGGMVRLLHSIPDLGNATGFLRAKDAIALKDKAKATMARALETLGSELLTGVDVRAVVYIDKDPLDAILDEVKSDGVEAIVLATSGRGRVQRAFMGSIADKVIRRARCPVVVIAANPDQ